MAQKELTPQERTLFAAKMTTRMLSANLNSSYVTTSARTLKRPSESWAEYTPKSDFVTVDKSKFLQKDSIKECVCQKNQQSSPRVCLSN